MSLRSGLFLTRAATALLVLNVALGTPPAAAETRLKAKGQRQQRPVLRHDPDAEENGEYGDPDLPGFVAGRIDKAEYLRLRDDWVARKRGLYDAARLPYNARALAIEEMQTQQESLRRAGKLDINTATWTSLGPEPIPNGSVVAGSSTAASGRITCIAVHPTNSNIVYVGAAQGGVYRTLDAGATWTALTDTIGSLAIGAIALAPSQPSTLFVGTGEGNGSQDSYQGVGVYRITNADTAPVVAPASPPATVGFGSNRFQNRGITKIVVHPTNPDVVFVGTTSAVGGKRWQFPTTTTSIGIYRSTNATTAAPTFTQFAVGGFTGVPVTDLVLDPTDATGNTLLLALRFTDSPGLLLGGIWRSTNATGSFTFTKTLSIPDNQSVRFAVRNIGAPGPTVLAATGGAGSGTVRKSTDGGQTWPTTLPAGAGFCGTQCFYDIAVDMDPTGAVVLLGGNAINGAAQPSGALRRSSDSGASFDGTHQDGLHADTHAIVFAPSDSSVVYLASDGGVWRSADQGATWASCNVAGLNATQFTSLALHSVDPNLMIGGTQDNGTELMSTGGTWSRDDGGDGGDTVVDQSQSSTTTVNHYHTFFNQVSATPTNALVGYAYSSTIGVGYIHRGCFAGAGNGINCNDTAVEFYAPLKQGPGSPNTIYFGSDRLYRSTDMGLNNAVVGTTTGVASTPFVAGQPITALAIAPTDDAVRVVGLKNGKVYRATTGVTSSNWVDASTGVPAKPISDARVDPNNPNVAYLAVGGFGVAAGQHVVKTTNLNASPPTWTVAGSGIPDVPVNVLAFNSNDSRILYAATDIGLFRTTDGGASWAAMGTGLPVVACFDVKYHAPSNKVRVATHGRGIWEIQESCVVGGAADVTSAAPAAGSPCSIAVSWSSAIATCGSTAGSLAYVVYRRQTSAAYTPTPADRVAVVPAGTTSYVDSNGLAQNTAYRYAVGALNPVTGVENAAGAQVNVTSTAVCSSAPAAFRFFTATARDGAVLLQWLSPPAPYGSIVIRRSVGSTPPSTPAAGTAVATKNGSALALDSFADATVVNGTQYAYSAFAYSGAGATGQFSLLRSALAAPVASTGQIRWSYNTGAAALAPPGLRPGPAGTGGVYAVSNDRILHGMEPGAAGGAWPAGWTPVLMNGPAQSRPPVVGVTITSGATTANRVVFLGSQDGFVRCVDAVTGAVVWTSPNLGAIVQASPAAVLSGFGSKFNLVLVGTRDASGDSRFVALNASDGPGGAAGTIAWSFDNGGGASAIGIISGGASVKYDVGAGNASVYFTSRAKSGGSQDTVWALGFNASTVSKAWSVPLGDCDASPILVPGSPDRLFVGTNSSHVHSLDAATGANRWTTVNGSAGGLVNLADGPVKGYVLPDQSSNRLYAATTNTLWAIADGGTSATTLWQVGGATIPNPSTPVKVQGTTTFVLGSGNGRLYQVDGVTGALIGTAVVLPGAAVVGAPAFDLGSSLVYVGTDTGTVFAVAVPLP